jgi:tRNA (guanine37-N1)-methyltransferase
VKYTVLSLFPEIVNAFFETSIMAKAVDRGILQYQSINIRDFAPDKHHTCDDSPYGGGAGMLMIPQPLGKALESAGAVKHPVVEESQSKKRVIYLSPSGKPFTQALAHELAKEEELILICGRYEGIDQRIIDLYVDDEISIGDYVISSGETAALVLIDATYRLVDSVITAESLEEESFSGGLLEYPQYTRPEIYDNMQVPDILLSGHHKNIRRWRLIKQIEKTLFVRPDLITKGLESGLFDAETRKLIEEMKEGPKTGIIPRGRDERNQGN